MTDDNDIYDASHLFKDEDKDKDLENVIKFHPDIDIDKELKELKKKNISEKEMHKYVLGSLDKIQEKIRNDTTVNGVFVISFSNEGHTDNWIMGDIPITLLYTALASFQQEILKMFNDPNDGTMQEID